MSWVMPIFFASIFVRHFARRLPDLICVRLIAIWEEFGSDEKLYAYLPRDFIQTNPQWVHGNVAVWPLKLTTADEARWSPTNPVTSKNTRTGSPHASKQNKPPAEHQSRSTLIWSSMRFEGIPTGASEMVLMHAWRWQERTLTPVGERYTPLTENWEKAWIML